MSRRGNAASGEFGDSFSQIETSLLQAQRARTGIGGDQGTGADEPDQRAHGEGDGGHPVEIVIDGSVAGGAGFGLGGGLPLEEALARDQAADQGADHGVEGEQHLVGEEDEGQQDGETSGVEVADGFAGGGGAFFDDCFYHAEDQLE